MWGRVLSRVRVLATCVRLAGLAVLTLLTAALSVVSLVMPFFGLASLTAAVIENGRQLTNTYRRARTPLAGRPIPEPYVPLPTGDARPAAVLADPATWRDLAWLLLMPVLGVLLGLLPTLAACYGLLVAGSGVVTLLTAPEFSDATPLHPAALLDGWAWLGVPVGLAVPVAVLACAPGLLRAHFAISATLLRPSAGARVQRLVETRARAVDAQAAELRRIERDLHDGAQARMVSLGMTLRAAERVMDTDPGRARELLAEARHGASRALDELRDLVRGVYPPVLAERGLVDAVRAAALETPVPVSVHADLPHEPEAPIAAALYFSITELLTNVAKHAPAASATVLLRADGDRVLVRVTDTGPGGARPAGDGGLRGIERRLAVFDGTLVVTSPPGGPTTVETEVPCALFSPKTSTF